MVSVLPTLLLRRCKVNAFCQISSSPDFPLFATIHLYLSPSPNPLSLPFLCYSSAIPTYYLPELTRPIPPRPPFRTLILPITAIRPSVAPRQFLRIISPNQPTPFPRAPHSAPTSYRSLPSAPPLLLGNSYVLSPRTNLPHSPAPSIPLPHPTDHSLPFLCYSSAIPTYYLPKLTRPIPPRPPFRTLILPITACRFSVVSR